MSVGDEDAKKDIEASRIGSALFSPLPGIRQLGPDARNVNPKGMAFHPQEALLATAKSLRLRSHRRWAQSEEEPLG
ncbi:hypothetical protein TGRH88_044690 [Toxoplasma gondii]|uniref:Uncharacterized protein n=1 Tax=Toxoplasma gondii TaxID=5811 RepID=A0A7J6JZC4_TOXGO|nr:hypothetical protein TGRH88_044690 [Toxoplasma gondii]